MNTDAEILSEKLTNRLQNIKRTTASSGGVYDRNNDSLILEGNSCNSPYY